MSSQIIQTEAVADMDRPEVRAFIQERWHASHVCIRGVLYEPHCCQGFLVRKNGQIVGLLTYKCQDNAILVLTQNSTESGTGIGTSMMLRVIEEARKQGVQRLWLTTTNDNLESLGFYQRMGFRLVAVYPDAVTTARQTIKPEVPEHGMNGLPIRDEIELELILEPAVT